MLVISGSPHRHFSFIPGHFRWEVFPSPVTLVRCPVPPFWDPPVGGVASWNRSSLTSPVTLVGLCCVPCSERPLVGTSDLFFTTYMCLVDPCREQCFLNKNHLVPIDHQVPSLLCHLSCMASSSKICHNNKTTLGYELLELLVAAWKPCVLHGLLWNTFLRHDDPIPSKHNSVMM